MAPQYFQVRTCDACQRVGDDGWVGTGSSSHQWFCRSCWRHWGAETQCNLPVMTWAEFKAKVREGHKWLVVDGTIIDVAPLTENTQTLHKGGADVLTRSIGDDITGYFEYLHANLPRVDSLHKPGLSHMEHVRQKVSENGVAMLNTHAHLTSLSSPYHRFWVEGKKKAAYNEVMSSSLAMDGVDAATYLTKLLGDLSPDSPRCRAFWAVIGCLVGDAAAQPTHWNYKLTYFHDELQKNGRWDNPEFMRPSMNTYYHIPLGSQTCYGDQALEVLHSLVDCSGLVPSDVERKFVQKFGEHGEYGPLPDQGLYTGNREGPRALPITGPWRHISLSGFLKNVGKGKHWPNCGTGDAQADCFVRVVPVVALYAGTPEMLDRVAEAVAVTQDNPPAIAVAQAFTRVLEAFIMAGENGSDAIGKAINEMKQEKSRTQVSSPQMALFYGRVAETMGISLDHSHLSLYDAVMQLCGGSYSQSKVS